MADQAPASAAAPIEPINPIDAPVAATTRPAVPASPIAASTDVRTTAPSLEDVIGAAVDAVVSIESRAGRGTGFFVDRNTVLTNAHVVEGASSVSLHTANGPARARVASVADDYDLAVLKIDGATAPHAVLPLAATPAARVGQEVIAIGFALGLLENTVTRGIISGIRQVGGITFLQTDAAINPGNSGGPLLDTSGRVLGVTTLKFGAQAESLGFAVAAEYARPLLAGGRPPAPTAAASRDSSESRRLAPLLTPNQTSAADRLRADGAQVYEQQVAAIAQQAAQIDRFWEQFRTTCLSAPPRGRYDRPWFSLYAGTVTVNQGGPQCASWMGDLSRLSTDISSAMASAAEAARRAGVYPGVQRDLRRRYRMSWRDWER